MKMFSEADVLSLSFRRQVISEIKGTENIGRKKKAYKRYEIYKDKTVNYVVEKLAAEGLDPQTVVQMARRAANISICKKVVNKLARTYLGGVTRDSGLDDLNEQVALLARLLNVDEVLKKADRYRELYKNCMIQVYPEPVSTTSTEEDPIYRVKARVLSPWQYDVIEDAADREKPRCVILSDFKERAHGLEGRSEAAAGRHDKNALLTATNKIDDTIADSPSDAGRAEEYIWWTDSYHFTTDKEGVITSLLLEEEPLNPVGRLPFIKVADDQDGQFWAEGGDDLIDGAVLVNTLMTDMFAIAAMQGWGQVVVTGKNLPDRIRIGPHNAVLLSYDPALEEPKPEFDVVAMNPPLDLWLKSIEQYVALLLSTNNLAPSTIANRLDATTFPSGIAMLVEQSEAVNDIQEKQAEFKAVERELWRLVALWQTVCYKANQLDSEFSEIGPLTEFDLNLKFHEMRQVVTEKEKLENLRLRKELGINEEIELMMIDNPDLTPDEAAKKLLAIKQEKIAQMMAFAPSFSESGEEDTKEEKLASE